jgi:hypothetical protein
VLRFPCFRFRASVLPCFGINGTDINGTEMNGTKASTIGSFSYSAPSGLHDDCVMPSLRGINGWAGGMQGRLTATKAGGTTYLQSQSSQPMPVHLLIITPTTLERAGGDLWDGTQEWNAHKVHSLQFDSGGHKAAHLGLFRVWQVR